MATRFLVHPILRPGALAIALMLGLGAGLAMAGQPAPAMADAFVYFRDSLLQAALDHAALGFGCFR